MCEANLSCGNDDGVTILIRDEGTGVEGMVYLNQSACVRNVGVEVNIVNKVKFQKFKLELLQYYSS